MVLFLAAGVGLAAWLLLSHISAPALIETVLSHLPSRIPYVGVHSSDVITSRLSKFIEDTLALENITGLSVAVIPKGAFRAEFYTRGYRTEDGDEVHPDTLFHMASVSKAFCATALGLLIEDFANGKNVTALPAGLTELTWHTRMRDLLPDWHLMDEWASERANLKDILSHVSGLPRHDLAYGPLDTPQEMITRLRHLRPAYELREKWSYNNVMYVVAAHVIETYSGQPYTAFVEKRIFTPLGMASSTFSPTKAKASGRFSQGWTKEGRRVPEGFAEELSLIMAGPGGIISNAVDMTKWISAWIGKGVYNNQTVIPLSVYQNLSYPYSVLTDPEHSIVGYGMGWMRSSYRGHDIVHHTGSLPGLSTLVSFLPDDEIGVTLFANGEGKATQLMSILNRILNSALHLTCCQTSTSSPRVDITTAEHGAKHSALSLDIVAGTYANPGYGSFTLCGPSSASPYCAEVRSNFSIVDSVQGNPESSGDLLAEWPRIWSSHVRMQHQQGSTFQVYFTSLYPHGYGKDTMPFETKDIGTTEGLAAFIVEDGKVVGFGLSGLLGEVTERARTHKTVQDRAEVWFDKI